MESPEERTFRSNPVALVLADRGKYIAACLTIARAYISAGRPGRLPPRASYEGWSDIVRSPLVWLGWSDPVETVASIRTEDPVRQQRAAVFAAWAAELTVGVGYQTSELIVKSEAWGQGERTCPELFAALFAVAASRGGGQQIDFAPLGTLAAAQSRHCGYGKEADGRSQRPTAALLEAHRGRMEQRK